MSVTPGSGDANDRLAAQDFRGAEPRAEAAAARGADGRCLRTVGGSGASGYLFGERFALGDAVVHFLRLSENGILLEEQTLEEASRHSVGRAGVCPVSFRLAAES